MVFAFSLPASQPAADQELLLQQLAVIAWSLHGMCGLVTAKIASSKGRNPAVSFVKVRAHSRCCLHVVPVSHPLSRSMGLCLCHQHTRFLQTVSCAGIVQAIAAVAHWHADWP